MSRGVKMRIAENFAHPVYDGKEWPFVIVGAANMRHTMKEKVPPQISRETREFADEHLPLLAKSRMPHAHELTVGAQLRGLLYGCDKRNALSKRFVLPHPHVRATAISSIAGRLGTYKGPESLAECQRIIELGMTQVKRSSASGNKYLPLYPTNGDLIDKCPGTIEADSFAFLTALDAISLEDLKLLYKERRYVTLQERGLACLANVMFKNSVHTEEKLGKSGVRIIIGTPVDVTHGMRALFSGLIQLCADKYASGDLECPVPIGLGAEDSDHDRIVAFIRHCNELGGCGSGDSHTYDLTLNEFLFGMLEEELVVCSVSDFVKSMIPKVIYTITHIFRVLQDGTVLEPCELLSYQMPSGNFLTNVGDSIIRASVDTLYAIKAAIVPRSFACGDDNFLGMNTEVGYIDHCFSLGLHVDLDFFPKHQGFVEFCSHKYYVTDDSYTVERLNVAGVLVNAVFVPEDERTYLRRHELLYILRHAPKAELLKAEKLLDLLGFVRDLTDW